jgi:hypothetical protein
MPRREHGVAMTERRPRIEDLKSRVASAKEYL